MPESFDPYYKWLGIPPSEQPPDHYRLLAIKPFEDDPDVIDAAADGRMAHLRNYQTSKNAALAQRLLNEVAAARIDLLNPQTRHNYDAQLRARLAAREAAQPVYQPHFAGAPPQPMLPPMPVQLPVQPPVAPPSAPFESFTPKPAPFVVDTSSGDQRRSSPTLLFGAVGFIVALVIGVGVLVALNLQRAKKDVPIAEPIISDKTTGDPTTAPEQTNSAASAATTTSSTDSTTSNSASSSSTNPPGSTLPQTTSSSTAATNGPASSTSSDTGSQSSTSTSSTSTSSPATSSVPGDTEWKGHSGPVHSVAFSADGRMAASGGEDRTVRLWVVAENRQVKWFENLPGPVREVRLSRDGQIVAASMPSEHKISVWNVNAPQQAVEIPTPPRKAGYHIDFSADGRYVILGGPTFTQVYDARQGSLVTEKKRDGYDVALSSDGQYFAYGGFYKQVNVAEVAGGRVEWASKDPTGHVRALDFAADQPYIAASGNDHVVRVWNVATGKPVTHFEVPDPAIMNIALSADGRRVITRNVEMIRAFEVTSGKQIFERQIQGAGEFDISPDGLRLIVGDVWGVIRLIPLPPLPTEGPQSLADLSPPMETPQPSQRPELITRIPPPPQKSVDARVIELRAANRIDPEASPEERLRLARMLIRQGVHGSDPVEQMATLSLAEWLARDAGDARLMLKAIDEIGLRFEVDELDRKLKALHELAGKASDETTADSLFANLMPVVDEMLSSEELSNTRSSNAATLRVRATELARKPQGKRYLKQMNEVEAEIGRIQRLWAITKSARDRLMLFADNPELNLVWGRWLCLQEGKWDAGLPYVAKGNDLKWKKAAVADLAAANGSPQDRRAAADGWYELAQHGLAPDKPAVLRRAAHWYRQLLTEIQDSVLQARFQNRIDEVGEGPVVWERVDEEGNLPPGKWVSVLGLVDLQRDAINGNWRQIAEAVSSSDENNAIKFELPVKIHGSYEFEFDFTARKSHLTAYLPVGENGCQLWLGHGPMRVSGLGWIDGKDAFNNPTGTPTDFRDGQRYRVVVRVEQSDADATITVWKDSRLLLKWKGSLDSLDGRRMNALRNVDQLGLGSSLGPVIYHTARVRLLSGEATLLPEQNEAAGFGPR